MQSVTFAKLEGKKECKTSAILVDSSFIFLKDSVTMYHKMVRELIIVEMIRDLLYAIIHAL
jgi:hypothetical protein